MTQAVIEDPGDPFLDEATHIASLYVDLFDTGRAKDVDRSPGPTLKSGRVATDSITTSGGPPPPANMAAAHIAQRLREIGDSIDEKVKKALQEALFEEKMSVYQLGPEQFSGVCRRVLSRCKDFLSTGWEQVTVVYMGVGSAVRELRSGSQEAAQRESMFNAFAGETLRELGLEQWIDQHGGMREIQSTGAADQTCVLIQLDEGTSVDA